MKDVRKMFKINITENKRQCEIDIRYFLEIESNISIPLSTITKEVLENEIKMTKARLLELVVKEAINEKKELDNV